MTKQEEALKYIRQASELIRELGECKKHTICANCKMNKTCLRFLQLCAQLRVDFDTTVDKS